MAQKDNPENVATWNLNDEGEVVEPCETDDDIGDGYTNWH